MCLFVSIIILLIKDDISYCFKVRFIYNLLLLEWCINYCMFVIIVRNNYVYFIIT